MRPLPSDLALAGATGGATTSGRGAGERDRPRYVDHDESDEGSESDEEDEDEAALAKKIEQPKDLTGQPCPAGKLWLQEGKKNRHRY